MELWTVIIFGAVANVGIIEWVKSFPGIKRFKPYFNWLPFVGAIVAGLATSSYAVESASIDLATWGIHTVGILSISVLGYQNIIEYVRSKLGDFKETTESTQHQ